MLPVNIRSLALFRIGLGLVVIVDLLNRLVDLGAHYTNVGVLPLNILFERHWNANYWSFHVMSGQTWLQILLFGATLVSAFMLLVGYRTRIAAIVTWALVVSLHNRNPIVLQGGDVLIRMLLFWSIFLPIGYRWSVDSVQRAMNPSEDPLASRWYWPPILALVLQVVYVYSFAGLIKLYEPSWQAGTGFYYALTTDQFSTFLAQWIVAQNWDLTLANHMVVWTELLGPLLLFIPHWSARMLAVLMFWGLHIGIMATLKVGIFSFAGIVAWLAFVPPQALDFIGRLLPGPVARLSALVEKSLGALAQTFHESTQYTPAPVMRRRLSLNAGLVTVLLIFVFLINCETVPRLKIRAPSFADPIRYTLRLDQRWNMFSKPFFDDGWLVVPALLSNGAIIDLNADDLVLRSAPKGSMSETYKRQRWRKYSMNLISRNYQKDRLEFARYFCKSWNDSHDASERVEVFHMVFMQKWNRPERLDEPAKPMLLWRHECRSGMLAQRESELIDRIRNTAPEVAQEPKK